MTKWKGYKVGVDRAAPGGDHTAFALLDDDGRVAMRVNVPDGAELSPALKRLVEEVRNEQAGTVPLHRYDRVHGRHNRSG